MIVWRRYEKATTILPPVIHTQNRKAHENDDKVRVAGPIINYNTRYLVPGSLFRLPFFGTGGWRDLIYSRFVRVCARYAGYPELVETYRYVRTTCL